MKSKAGRLAHDSRYREEHPEIYAEKNREKQRRWALNHPKEKAKRKRNWNINNPEKVKMYTRLRRFRKLNNGGAFTEEQWLKLKAQYNNVCLCCRRSEAELLAAGLQIVPDHVLSVVQGGSNNIDNIQPLCHASAAGSRGGCNNIKRHLHIDFRK